MTSTSTLFVQIHLFARRVSRQILRVALYLCGRNRGMATWQRHYRESYLIFEG